MLKSSSRVWFLEDISIVSGLIAVQVVYGFYNVFLNKILTLGLEPLFLVIFGNLATAMFLLPFALIFERKKWPKKFDSVLVIEFVLIALGGVTIYQTLLLWGVKKTSPEVVSAMPNLTPGFIFIIAACLRLEKVEMRCKYTWTKILGTLMCLSGAIAMSLLETPTSSPSLASSSQGSLSEKNNNIDEEWIIGCGFLLVAFLVLSFVTVLQAVTMKNFQAPITLCIVTSFMGAIFTAILKIFTQGKLDFGSTVINLTSIIGIVLMGGIVCSVCITFQTWSIHKKGPVLVSLFSPIQTVCSVFLSAFLLRHLISLQSMAGMAGMVVMFVGLYMVLWAKKKELCSVLDDDDHVTKSLNDVEKPLLA